MKTPPPNPRAPYLLINIALVGGMIACLATALTRWMSEYFGADYTWIIPFAFLGAVEAQLTSRFLDRGLSFSQRWLHILVFETGGIFLVLKAVALASKGGVAAWEEISRWPAEFPIALFPEDFQFLCLTVFGGWLFSKSIAGHLMDLENIQAGPDTERVMDPFGEQTRAQAALTSTILVLGGALIVAGVFAMHILPRMSSRNPFPSALGPEILGFFICGFGLLSFSNYALQRASWSYDHIPVSSNLPTRWLIYSIVFLIVVTLLAMLLPAGYTEPFLRLLLYIAMIVFGLMRVFFSLLALPLFLIFRLLGISQSGGTAPSPPQEFVDMVAEQTAPEAGFWDYARAIFFWIAAAGIVYYVLRQLFLRRSELIRKISRARKPWWLSKILDWISRRTSHLRREAAVAIRRTISGLRSRLRMGITDRLRDIHFHRLSPRQILLASFLALVRRGADAGLARSPAQPPLEYGRALASRLPDGAADAQLLAEGFVEARYSTHPIPADRAVFIRAAWQRMRDKLQPGSLNGEQSEK